MIVQAAIGIFTNKEYQINLKQQKGILIMKLVTRKVESQLKLDSKLRKKAAIRKQVETFSNNINEYLPPHIKGFVCQMFKDKPRLKNGRFC